MKNSRISICVACALFASLQTAAGRGVSPYLPLKMAPDIERKIEQVLILAGKPVMRRPIAAATVLDALPRACATDKALCDEVTDYLRRYMRTFGITAARVEGAYSSGDSTKTIPNSHGQTIDSSWRVNASGYYQPSDYLLINAGGVAYEGNSTPTGSMLSAGFDFAQLDIGYRDHWFSPLNDISALIGAQAATMPSITVSNYEPISPLGLSYEIFAARMSQQDNIAYFSTSTSGHPRLAGLQLTLEPTDGFALSANRLMQYGGGARGGRGLSEFKDALIDNPNAPDIPGSSEEFGNQVAAITSSILFPGRVPFGFRLEYAGEDNAYAASYRLGAVSMSVGLDFPKLFEVFDANIEINEFQNDWYTHHLYPLGLTNDHHVIGAWFGDERVPGLAIGGRSQSVHVGWRPPFGGYVAAQYRSLAIDADWTRPRKTLPYRRMHELGVDWSSRWRGVPFDLGLDAGRDVFGENFVRLTGSVDFMNFGAEISSRYDSADSSDGAEGVEYFVDFGGIRSSVNRILNVGQPSPPDAKTSGVHLAIGARRPVSERGDIGARIEYDDVDGNMLLSLRALDYRYRIFRRFAINGFLGFGRYDEQLPAYGYLWGGGVEYLDVIPKWDVGLHFRHYEKLNRDKALPTDPAPNAAGHPRLYTDVEALTAFVTRRW